MKVIMMKFVAGAAFLAATAQGGAALLRESLLADLDSEAVAAAASESWASLDLASGTEADADLTSGLGLAGGVGAGVDGVVHPKCIASRPNYAPYNGTAWITAGYVGKNFCCSDAKLVNGKCVDCDPGYHYLCNGKPSNTHRCGKCEKVAHPKCTASKPNYAPYGGTAWTNAGHVGKPWCCSDAKLVNGKCVDCDPGYHYLCNGKLSNTHRCGKCEKVSTASLPWETSFDKHLNICTQNWTLKRPGKLTADACAQLCRSTAGCEGFVMPASTRTSGAVDHCFLGNKAFPTRRCAKGWDAFTLKSAKQ